MFRPTENTTFVARSAGVSKRRRSSRRSSRSASSSRRSQSASDEDSLSARRRSRSGSRSGSRRRSFRRHYGLYRNGWVSAPIHDGLVPFYDRDGQLYVPHTGALAFGSTMGPLLTRWGASTNSLIIPKPNVVPNVVNRNWGGGAGHDTKSGGGSSRKSRSRSILKKYHVYCFRSSTQRWVHATDVWSTTSRGAAKRVLTLHGQGFFKGEGFAANKGFRLKRGNKTEAFSFNGLKIRSSK